jgi:hypothetical protein
MTKIKKVSAIVAHMRALEARANALTSMTPLEKAYLDGQITQNQYQKQRTQEIFFEKLAELIYQHYKL